MASANTFNSIKLQHDKLITTTTGFYVSQPGAGFDLTEAQTVTGFSLSVNEPIGTNIYYAFKTADYWFSLNANGIEQNIAATIDYETLEAYGNTTAQLRALNDIPAFVGKIVMVALGLKADDISSAAPSISKLAVNWQNSNQMLRSTKYSPVYELGSEAQIASIRYDPAITGDASITVEGQITREDGSVSEWLPVASLSGEKATALQFRGTYAVNDIASGQAKIREATVLYANGSNAITGQNDTELYSITQNWYMNIKQCRLRVKHSHLTLSNIHVYVALRDAPILVQGEILGTSTGTRKTYQLGHPDGVKYDTVRLYVNNQQIYTGYEINSEVGRVTLTAGEGDIISADYEYNWEGEAWQEMPLTSRMSLPDYDCSEYRIALEETGKSVCALKLLLHMEDGHTENEQCGSATGILQTIRLAHIIKDGVAKVYVNGTELDSMNWQILTDPQYIQLTAPENSTITISYDWISEIPTVYQFAGIFAE